MRLAWPILLCLGAGCKTDDEPAPKPAVCITDPVVLASSDRAKAIEEGCGEVLLTDFRVLGEGSFTVELYTDGSRLIPGLRAQEDGSVFRAFHMRGHVALEGPGSIRWWRRGWGVSGGAGVVEPGTVQRDVDDLPLVGGADGPEGEVPWGSWWAGMVTRQGGPAAIVGVHAARATPFRVAYDADGSIDAVWGGLGEEIAAADGEIVFLDPLFLGVGPDPVTLWQTWIDTVADEHLVDLTAADPPVAWRVEGALLDEAVIAEHLDRFGSFDPTIEAPGVVVLGEGWASAAGDWVAGPALPSGGAAVASMITDGGRVAGLRWSPLLVDRGVAAYADHPDWWVRELDGSERDVDGAAVLDVTHDDAAGWLQDEAGRLTAEGFRVLELADLEAAAGPGLRTAGVPGVTAHRAALDAIRRGTGDGVRLVALDGPLLPSVGLVDGYAAAASHDSVADQGRTLAARWPTHQRWWALQAPALDAASPDPRTVALAVASGGGWTVTGDLGLAEPAATLSADLTGDRGLRSIPEGVADAVGGLWDAPVPDTWPRADGATVLLNLADVPVSVDGPGGVEVLTGEVGGPGPRTLAPQAAEVWRP